jgi:outer membrane protein TolC
LSLSSRLAVIVVGVSLGAAGAMAPARAQQAAAAASVRRVTWQEALDLAVARNPSAAVAELEIARAEGLLHEARAAWLPTLSGNLTYIRLNQARTFAVPGAPPTVTVPINTWDGALQLNVPIIAPVAWANSWHADDNRKIAIATADDVHRQIATAVGRTYLTVLLSHRELEVAARARDNAREHYEYAHTRLAMGLGNGVDDARAEQELRTDEAQLANAETALVRSQNALAVLLSEEELVDAADDVTLAGAPDARSAIDRARQSRTDVRLLEAHRTAAENLRHDQWVYYAPTLLAQVLAFRETQTLQQPGSGWQATVVLSIPFYDGGLRYGIHKERKAIDEEARVQLDASLRQVSVEVRSAFRVVENTDQSLLASRAAAIAARTAAALADKSYRAGASTNIEVVDAERRARDADTQVALAEDAARQARLDLLLATGAFP